MTPDTSQPIILPMHAYWPAIIIGLIVGFYWGRVIKLVLKTRRDTGRAANFVPPEPLGKVLRILWYPNVICWVTLPFIIGLIRHHPWLLAVLYELPVLAWAAVVVGIFALYATLVCWRKMGKSWRMGIDPNEKTQLVFTGPWAYVRHPIYALQSLLMVATVVAIPAPSIILIAAIQVTFLQWEASREEKYLVQLHGPDYSTYIRHVGRFLPRSFAAYVRGA